MSSFTVEYPATPPKTPMSVAAGVKLVINANPRWKAVIAYYASLEALDGFIERYPFNPIWAREVDEVEWLRVAYRNDVPYIIMYMYGLDFTIQAGRIYLQTHGVPEDVLQLWRDIMCNRHCNNPLYGRLPTDTDTYLGLPV